MGSDFDPFFIFFFYQWGNYFVYEVFDAFFVNKIELPIGYKYKLLLITYPAGYRVRVVIFVCFAKQIYKHQSTVKPRRIYSRNRQNNNVGICDPTL